MKIIFNNLPSKMSAYEIRRLVSSVVLPKGIVETTKSIVLLNQRIKRLEFKVITEMKSGRECRYGIAIVEPDKAAERIISRLRDNVYHGHRLSVREYNSRSYSNDRRNVSWRELVWEHSERRVQERRISAQSVSAS